MEQDPWIEWQQKYRAASQAGRLRLWNALTAEQRQHATQVLGVEIPQPTTRKWLPGCAILGVVGLGGLLLIVGIGNRGDRPATVRTQVAAPAQGEQPAPAAQLPRPAPAPAAAQWVAVKEWSGSGIKNTETFEVRGREWRIQWSSPDLFQIYLYREDGQLAGVAANAISGGKDTSYHRGSGRYYLMVNATGSWNVTVEESR